MAAWSDSPDPPKYIRQDATADRADVDIFGAPTYGSALHPLGSVYEGCPDCEGDLIASLGDSIIGGMVGAFVLSDEERQHYRRIRKVECGDCGWQGSAWRPEFTQNRDPGDETCQD